MSRPPGGDAGRYPWRRPLTHLYVRDPSNADRLRLALEGQSSISLDCEAAGFHRYSDRLCLVQISTPAGSVLVDPLAFDPSDLLRPILEDPSVRVVMHGADYDLRLLDRDLGINIAGLFDTQIAASLLGEESVGLSSLLERHFGVRLSKKYQRADWAQRPLSQDLLDYAVSDTEHLHELAALLEERLIERGRLSWAREEFGRLEAIRWEDDPGVDPVTRVKKARDLTPRETERLRVCLAWRDEIARTRDRAPFRIAGDAVLIKIARERPGTVDALAGLQGMSPALARSSGADLLSRLAEADGIPADRLVPYPRRPRGNGLGRPTPEEEERAERLKRIRNREAQALGIDRGVILANSLVLEIARLVPRSLDELAGVPGIRKWQVEALGDALMEALGNHGARRG